MPRQQPAQLGVQNDGNETIYEFLRCSLRQDCKTPGIPAGHNRHADRAEQGTRAAESAIQPQPAAATVCHGKWEKPPGTIRVVSFPLLSRAGFSPGFG